MRTVDGRQVPARGTWTIDPAHSQAEFVARHLMVTKVRGGFDISSAPAFVEQPEWKRLRAVQSGRVFMFDCGLTCRTGPRIVDMDELLFATLYEDTEQT